MESVGELKLDLKFYQGKRVFVTGHTGFKGMWLCKVLEFFGAEVTGYALPAPTAEGEKALQASGVLDNMHAVIGDMRDFSSLKKAFAAAKPEIVFHLAAQPIVLTSYRAPRETYETNVMGTVNVLECVRETETVKSFLNVTTDKVYENKEWIWGYRESEPLDGFDPYSNSKSCSELVTHSYARSFFADSGTAISTMRAGNVIGGGDFAENRIIPDCIRATVRGSAIRLRNPYSTRPYQHVLEPLFAYLLLAGAQCENRALAGWYNIGPDECDCVTTGALATLFCKAWGEGAHWETIAADTPHEANFLKLDSTKLKAALAWSPRWHIDRAVKKTVEWTKAWYRGDSISSVMDEEIKEFLEASRT